MIKCIETELWLWKCICTSWKSFQSHSRSYRCGCICHIYCDKNVCQSCEIAIKWFNKFMVCVKSRINKYVGGISVIVVYGQSRLIYRQTDAMCFCLVRVCFQPWLGDSVWAQLMTERNDERSTMWFHSFIGGRVGKSRLKVFIARVFD